MIKSIHPETIDVIKTKLRDLGITSTYKRASNRQYLIIPTKSIKDMDLISKTIHLIIPNAIANGNKINYISYRLNPKEI